MHPDVEAALKEFTEALLKEFDGLIKVIWAYGSAVRGEAKPTSDVDIMVLLDDVVQEIPDATIAAVSDGMAGLIAKIKEEKGVSLHPQATRRLTDWWDMLRSGEPWVFTAMRDAVVLHDPSGFIGPLQKLLKEGRLAGSEERAAMLLQRVPWRLEKIRKIFLDDIMLDLLTAMLEASHAVLMIAGKAPPAAKNIGEALHENFVKSGLLADKYADFVEDFYQLTKKVERGELTRISGADVDRYCERVIDFIQAMEALLAVLEERNKTETIKGAWADIVAACGVALKQVGERPVKEGRELLDAVERHLIRRGLISKAHLAALRRVLKLRQEAAAGRLGKVPERDVYSSRMYARDLKIALEEIPAAKKKG